MFFYIVLTPYLPLPVYEEPAIRVNTTNFKSTYTFTSMILQFLLLFGNALMSLFIMSVYANKLIEPTKATNILGYRKMGRYWRSGYLGLPKISKK